MSDSLRPHGLQHTKLPHPSPSPGVYSNSHPLDWWYHPTVSSSVTLLSSLQSFPTSRSFPVSQLFTSGGQNIGASTSATVLPVNTQDLFPLGLTDLISLQSEELSRVFSSTTIQKNQINILNTHMYLVSSFILIAAVSNCPLLFHSSILDTFRGKP